VYQFGWVEPYIINDVDKSKGIEFNLFNEWVQ
jgi:hypothetical protein